MAVQLRHLLPVAAFQTRAVPSSLAVTMRWPSGENAALLTASVWPSSFATCCPVAAFQIRAVPSSLAVTMRWPSGENAALLTGPEWPSSFATCCPVAAFQTRAVLSKLAVTMRWPSGENAALVTKPVWPSSFSQQLPTGRVPDPCRLISARGDDALAVRGERGAVDIATMACPASPAAAQWPRSRPVPSYPRSW